MRRWIVGVGAAGALMVAFLFLTGADVIRRGVTTVYNLMYRCTGTGCVSRSISSKLGDVVSVCDFEATCPNGSDDTTAINAAFASAYTNGSPTYAGRTVIVPSGSYKVTGAITIGSGQHIIFQPGVTFTYTGSVNTSMLNIAGQSNVTIEGNGAVMSGNRAAGVGGAPFGDCMDIYGSSSVSVSNLTCQNWSLDGFYIGGAVGLPSNNVIIQNVTSNNNYRTGLSVVNAKHVQVIGGKFSGSNGTATQGGFDIEPDPSCTIEDVSLIGVRTESNYGPGIQLTPQPGGNVTGARYEVAIIGGKSYRDNVALGSFFGGLFFRNGATITNQMYGQVVVDGFVVDQDWGAGVSFYNWDADKLPKITLRDVTVISPNLNNTNSGTCNKSGFCIYADSTQAITNLGNIALIDCTAADPAGVMVTGFYVNADSGKTVKNVRIENPKSSGFTATPAFNVFAGPTATAVFSNVDVVYTRPDTLSVSGGGDYSQGLGQRLQITSSGNNWNLPPAASCIGSHYEFTTDGAGTLASILPNGTDVIQWPNGGVTANIVLDDYATVVLRSHGANGWAVEQMMGRVQLAGTQKPNRVVWNNVAPTTGTWAVGDVAWNNAPVVGGVAGWTCTVAGTPGTWVPIGWAGSTTGLAGDGVALKHKRGTAGCTTAAAAGALCTTTVTWTTAFADANYTVACTGAGINAGTPALVAYSAKAAASVTVQTMAVTAVASQFANVECVAFHD